VLACTPRPFDVARVAVVVPLTGERAGAGREVVDGARLAVEEWNGAGGVHGLHVELITADESLPAWPRRVAADPRIVLAVGHPDAAGAAPARQAYAEARAPAAVLLAGPPVPIRIAGVVQLAPAVDQVADTAVAAIAFNFGPVNVAVVASGSDEDIAAARAFVRAAPARGLRVRGDFMLAPVETNHAQAAALLRSIAPQVVYVVGRGLDAGALWAEIRPRDSRIRLVLGPGALDDGFYRTASGFLDGVSALELTARPADVPAAAEFVRVFTARYGRPPSALAARGYDAAVLGLRAVAAASDGRRPSRTAVRAALDAETALQGVLGSYSLSGGMPGSWKLALFRLDHEGAVTLIGEPEAR
jgi:branched-chain amino acid transport system substrate-binding protein